MTTTPEATYRLIRHPEPLAVVRLGPGSDVPTWAGSSSILTVSATADETTVVCAAAGVPKRAPQEGPFTAFEVQGPLDFSLAGVLAGLLGPLAEAGVPVFTISTFGTDWILVPGARADDAEEAWRRRGHDVTTPSRTHSG